MLRRGCLRGFLPLAALLAGLVATRDARADDPIDLEGLSPEMLGALGGSVPPEVLAALMAAMNGTRAAQTALPASSGDPAGMSSMLEGVDANALREAGGPAVTRGGVVDVHPDEHPPPHHGPERIGPGHSAGIVDLHPSVASPAPEPTTLPTMRVGPVRGPRRGHILPSGMPHDVRPHVR